MSSISGRTGLAWNAMTDDSTTTVGVGLNGRISRNLSFGFDWVSSDATGRMRTERGQGEAPFPLLRSDLQNARLHFSYQLSDRWSAKFYAEREKYDSTDWALDDLGPDGLLAVLTLGAVSPDYRVTVIRIQASYRF
jgi:hypothetical protein